MNCAHANPNVFSLDVKLMTGDLIQAEMNQDCTVECLKKKLVENIQIFGLNADHLCLFYSQENEKEFTDDAEQIFPYADKMFNVFVCMDDVLSFSQKYVTAFTVRAVTLDFTNFDLRDTHTFKEWLLVNSSFSYKIHLNSSSVFNATMNADNVTDYCPYGGTYVLTDFEIYIHLSADPVTKDDLKGLYFSLPPNQSRASAIYYIVDEGVFSDSVYTTKDFLDDIYR
jgi:hypothetical protein